MSRSSAKIRQALCSNPIAVETVVVSVVGIIVVVNVVVVMGVVIGVVVILIVNAAALWSGTNMNRDVSTAPLARPIAHSLAPLIHSLAPDCSLCLRPSLRALIRALTRSLAHSLRSLPRSWESDWMAIYCVFFFSILTRGA